MVEQFVAWQLSDKGHSRRTVETYALELNLLGKFLGKPIEDATTADLRRWMAQYANAKATTRGKKIHALRSFYNWLVNVQEYRTDNPASKLQVPKKEGSLPKYLRHDEVLSLKDNVTDPTLGVLIDVMYATGIRISEAIGMQRKDVLWQEGKIRVTGKGSKTREIPISETALVSLRRYLNSRHDDDPALFLNRFGRPLCARTVQKHIAKLGKEAGIERINVHPHTLRHSFATTLRSLGRVRIEDLALWMGHASLQPTTIYAKLIDEEQIKQYNQAVPKGM